MKKLFKIALFGLILIFSINQSAYSSESIVNSMIDDDFIAWSNSIPKEEAEIQLRDFLSSFDSWDEAKKWLTSKGFEVGKSRLMSENSVSMYGINQYPVFANGAGWSPKKQGIIFANGWLRKLESKFFVYGVSIEILYSEKPFLVHLVNITETRL